MVRRACVFCVGYVVLFGFCDTFTAHLLTSHISVRRQCDLGVVCLDLLHHFCGSFFHFCLTMLGCFVLHVWFGHGFPQHSQNSFYDQRYYFGSAKVILVRIALLLWFSQHSQCSISQEQYHYAKCDCCVARLVLLTLLSGKCYQSGAPM